jgi:prepilin-type N-terminal cleavage/methylation domain-containing protein/prepilin-type processing-associated H-X9-DG protein
VFRTRGFTIVELISVLAIIALLIGLLVPVVGRVMRAGNATKCLSQIRDLEQAHHAYALDHQGQFIDVGLSHGGVDAQDIAWVNTLADYYDTPLVLRSPLDTSSHWSLDDGGEGVPIPGTVDRFRITSYGCNNFLSRSKSPWAALDPARAHDRFGRVQNPANTVHFLIMAFEGDFAGSDHVHVENWWNDPPRLASREMQLSAVSGEPISDAWDDPQTTYSQLWNARSNYGFLDGHVAAHSFADVYTNAQINRFDPQRSHLIAAWVE